MANKSPITWIFVADDKKAKILINEGPKTGLKPLLVEDVKARLQQAGKQRDQKTSSWWLFGSNSKKENIIVKKKPEGENLIDDVVQVLNKAARREHFDTLVLVGPKSTLTEIHLKLTPAVEKRIHGELSKDLTNASEGELERYLKLIINL